ncbi:hypothetical protein Gohar_010014 [Gossypium harknessii]|uniref:Calmodulin-binding domain-containing protein n=1 Tax=Gossypium harknessii TaxID=34285 RepID=A0A7J9GPL1_9ROSI|nr:hypothetical protein [Gossypium harknessii]
MAAESVGSSMTPEIPGINGGDSRRSSLSCPANNKERTRSLYRRASIGSCHHICKPEKKHESEEKAPKLPFPKRITKKAFDEPKLFENLELPPKKKIVKPETSTNSPSGSSSGVKKVVSMKEKASMAKVKAKYPPNSRRHSIDITDVVNFEDKKTSMTKLKSSPKLKPDVFDAGKVVKQDRSLPSKKVQSKANERSCYKRSITCLKPKNQAERNSGIDDMKTGKRNVIKELAASQKASSTGATSLATRKYRNLKVVPKQKDRNKVENGETEQLLDEHDTLQEKTLYVIKLETENMMLESDKNENCAAELSPPIVDESGYAVTKVDHDSVTEYGEDKTVNTEAADNSSNNGPLRLKSGQGRETDGDTNDIVSRHKDVQGKIDGKSLFNNVIKETANKLVETRKNKVMTIVGAFETAISLQDSKPLSNVASW